MSGHSAIPRRIIQTGRRMELSLFEEATVAALKALTPEFEHVYYTDEDIIRFIDQEFPKYRIIFDRFPYAIQRIDFFRYLAVYRLGGFYFDLDVLLARSLNSLTMAGCVFPFEEITFNKYLRTQLRIDWEIGNYGFGATPGHPFLHAVIENCVRGQEEPAWISPMMRGVPPFFRSEFEVLNTTGPGMVTRTLAENPHLASDMTVLFPDDVCDSRTWHQFGNYGVHLMSASWRSRGSFLRRRLALMWENRVRRATLAESRKYGKQRVLPLAVSA